MGTEALDSTAPPRVSMVMPVHNGARWLDDAIDSILAQDFQDFELILVDDGKAPLNLKLIHNCAAHGLLHYPATSRVIQSVLMLAREHFQYERRLRGRIEKLDENLRTMRVVERAKVLLIRLKNLTEDEAYNFLRKQAMEKRVTIAAVATAVIDSHDLLS